MIFGWEFKKKHIRSKGDTDKKLDNMNPPPHSDKKKKIIVEDDADATLKN